jgi:hypothetical protein
MGDESTSSKSRPAGMVRALVIVTRGRPDLWQSLTRHFAKSEDVRVILDRRQVERRQQVQTYEPDRRRVGRRRPPSPETDVHSRQYVIVRPTQ